jgi:NADH-quinone oxidoreductase subunit E
MNRTIGPEILDEIRAIAARYPRREAALLPALRVLQRASGTISVAEEQAAAEVLGLNPVRVREAVSFYSLFLTGRAGEHIIRLCVSLSCSISGSGALLERLSERLGIPAGGTTSDGKFTLQTVECLGNCDRAPCLMIDDQDHERVTVAKLDEILERWK